MSANSSVRNSRNRLGGNNLNQPSLVEEDMDNLEPEQRAPFVRVMYGDGNQLIMNLTCLNKHLKRVIRKKCRLEKSGEYDLISTKGELCQYWTKCPTDYAQDCLSEREVYVLVKLETNNPDTNQQKLPNGPVKWTPLVDSLDDYPELKEILENDDLSSLNDTETPAKKRTESDPSKFRERRVSRTNQNDARKMSVRKRINGKY